MMLSLDTAYRSFGGEVEASSTPTICRLSDSRRHQLWAIAPSLIGLAVIAAGRLLVRLSRLPYPVQSLPAAKNHLTFPPGNLPSPRVGGRNYVSALLDTWALDSPR